jgi:hypothetical protein
MSPSAISPSLPAKEHAGKYIDLPEYPQHMILASLHCVILLI